MLLCLLLNSYATFRDTILYSRDTLTLNEVYEALFSKEKMKQLIVGPKAHGENEAFIFRTPKVMFSNPSIHPLLYTSCHAYISHNL